MLIIFSLTRNTARFCKKESKYPFKLRNYFSVCEYNINNRCNLIIDLHHIKSHYFFHLFVGSLTIRKGTQETFLFCIVRGKPLYPIPPQHSSWRHIRPHLTGIIVLFFTAALQLAPQSPSSDWNRFIFPTDDVTHESF